MIMAEVQLPPPPPLHGDVILDVFTHRSLRQEGGGGDNERYAALGEKVFEAAITHSIFKRFPQYQSKEIKEEREKLLSDEYYEQWITFYRFREKLRYNPNAVHTINTPQGARELFHAYVGGVYTQPNGSSMVNTWAYNLTVPPEARIFKAEEEEPTYFRPPPPPPNVPYPAMPPPPPPANFSYPPPRSRTSSFSSGRNSMAFDDPNSYNIMNAAKVVWLPRFNEICTQRRWAVEYIAENTGLQHAPRWIVRCHVNGEIRGQGTATTKQLAKEEAAKQAWVALGLP